MHSQIEHLFAELSEQPDKSLYGAVLARVALARQRGARIRLAVSGSTFLASLGALAIAANYTYNAFVSSGFFQYLKLLISDADIALVLWREFALSLAESLPVMALAIFLVAVFVFLVSLRSALLNLKPALKLAA